MNIPTRLPLGLLTLLVLLACSSETNPPKLTPGQYEVDIKMNTKAGLNFSGIRGKYCLRGDDVKYADPKVDTAVRDGTCSISSYQVTGKRISYEFNCSGEKEKEWSRSVELKVISETEFNTKASHSNSGDTMTVDAKRIGEC